MVFSPCPTNRQQPASEQANCTLSWQILSRKRELGRNTIVFLWTGMAWERHHHGQEEDISSTCRVTGVSSPNLARCAILRAGLFFFTQRPTQSHVVSFLPNAPGATKLRFAMLRRTNPSLLNAFASALARAVLPKVPPARGGFTRGAKCSRFGRSPDPESPSDAPVSQLAADP